MAQEMTVMAPAGTNRATATIGGRTYACSAGETIEVPYSVGLDLARNGWPATCIHGSGTTAGRPYGKLGLEFHDTTIEALIRFDGKNWRHALTGAVV